MRPLLQRTTRMIKYLPHVCISSSLRAAYLALGANRFPEFGRPPGHRDSSVFRMHALPGTYSSFGKFLRVLICRVLTVRVNGGNGVRMRYEVCTIYLRITWLAGPFLKFEIPSDASSAFPSLSLAKQRRRKNFLTGRSRWFVGTFTLLTLQSHNVIASIYRYVSTQVCTLCK